MLKRIGHNRTVDLAETIRERLDAYNDAVIVAEQATQEAQLKALAAIFELDHWFQDYPEERDAFYQVNKIKVDPRSKHQSQPLVKHFLVSGELTKSLRNKITLWAGAITEAQRQEVEPEDFIQFIDSTPEGILGAYMSANRSLKNKEARGGLADKYQIADEVFRHQHESVQVSDLNKVYKLPKGKRLAVIDVGNDGNASISAILDRDQAFVEQSYRDHVIQWYDNGCKPNSPQKIESRKRYEDSKASQHPIVLEPDDPVVVEGSTRHQHLVRTPSPDDWVLKSGEHSRKLGSTITKGKWKGFPVFGLTLEERATCPRSCHQWLNCYGNGMSQFRAFRYKHGDKLIEALDRELTILSSEPKTRNGFAIRLHNLGDFYDVTYVEFWKDKLIQHPALRVFGFTAWHPAETDIGRAIKGITDKHWDRFAIRFSNQTGMNRGSSVISSEEQAPAKGHGIICPAELSQTQSCSTCAYCWQSEKPVLFVEH